MRTSASLLVLAAILGGSFASSGDRSPDFEKCVSMCQVEQCNPPQLELALKLTRWTCKDDCKYSCMHDITNQSIERGARVEQYYGKWPFWRFAGMQEPASVAFSLLNLWAHAKGASKVRRCLPNNHPMRPYYIIWSFASMNAWFWSSVFHTRGKS